MTIRKTTKPTPDGAAAVDAWFVAEAPAMQPELQLLRTIIRGVSPEISEGIKWNAPSFSRGEHFATFNPRHRFGVQIVMHFGVKPRADIAARTEIDDPAKLLQWKAADRALVTFADGRAVHAHRAAFESILRQWLTYLPGV